MRTNRAREAVDRLVKNNEGSVTQRQYREVPGRYFLRPDGGAWVKRYLREAYKQGLDNAARQLGLDPRQGLTAAHRREIERMFRDALKDLKKVARDTARELAEKVRASET